MLLCADRLQSQAELESALGHELVHAYDHCRKGMRIPGVRTQIPWALDCPNEACTEVRARHARAHPPWHSAHTAAPRTRARRAYGWGALLLPFAFQVRAYSMATFADAPSWVDKRALVYGSALQSLMSNPGSECGRAAAPSGADREANCRAALDACFERCLADVAPFSAEGRAASERGSYPQMPGAP